MIVVIIFAAALISGVAIRCYDCDHTQPILCNKTVECSGSNTTCFTGIDRRGCSSWTHCNVSANGITTCCDSDLCNNITLPTAMTTVEPSLRCYFCSQLSPDRCSGPPQRLIRTCNVGQVCRAVVNFSTPSFPGDKIKSFIQDCFDASNCQGSDACSGPTGGNCIKCCDCDLCNDATVVQTPIPGISVETCVATTILLQLTPPTNTATTSPAPMATRKSSPISTTGNVLRTHTCINVNPYVVMAQVVGVPPVPVSRSKSHYISVRKIRPYFLRPRSLCARFQAP